MYAAGIGFSVVYLWPIISFFRCGTTPSSPPPKVQRRAVSAPVVVAVIGFSGWLSGVILFPLVTLAHFGRWSTELMSQQVLSQKGQRLILVLDGLDEAEGTSPDDLQNPLRRILPEERGQKFD